MSHTDATATASRPTDAQLVQALTRPKAYPNTIASGSDPGPIELHQTHISWVFLVGDHAFKVKKPVRNAFLDYSTLEKRKHFCEEELRLDRRFAADLYLDVVPVTLSDGQPVMEGDGVPIEYAVKMRRFPSGALLSERIESDKLTTDEVFELARCVADFHQSAERLDPKTADKRLGSIEVVYRNATDNLSALRGVVGGDSAKVVRVLFGWTDKYFNQHRRVFAQRVVNGFIRECHGDMHLANIVHWGDQLIPFDGIEFNESFRWIDVLSDAAFAAMDFAARERLDLSRSFINAYLEHTGDHASLIVLRWYLVYRALIRAKVAAIRASQPGMSVADQTAAMNDCEHHVELAYQFSLRERPQLWITHGVSGSGKTTASQWAVQQHGAIRLRSDIERKRHFGLAPSDRLSDRQRQNLYCETANHATYERLHRMARCILRSGYPVIIDATFLRQADRQTFRSLAAREGATFGILDCHADEQTLRQRITDRIARDDDASDADLAVLDQQLATRQPLTEQERDSVVELQD
ncbi:AAA family ATPase [Rhodopirellula sp. JC639]|uniref:bifunctional aminoglycoside phosphotransferase/ATP-binding protein n=1 Tax=Stieleria mannarensis TaxID=2755585 RepID=UPI0015FFABAB|nr:bifunctional aminoglycoside phosphotransferase/ATP-binding protein [Rhodopirellula sp. JC639]